MTDTQGENTITTMSNTLISVIEPNSEDAAEVRISDETVATAKAVLETLQLDSTQNGAMIGAAQVTLLKSIPTGAVSVDFLTRENKNISVDINGNTVTINGVETSVADVRNKITALGIELQ